MSTPLAELLLTETDSYGNMYLHIPPDIHTDPNKKLIIDDLVDQVCEILLDQNNVEVPYRLYVRASAGYAMYVADRTYKNKTITALLNSVGRG